MNANRFNKISGLTLAVGLLLVNAPEAYPQAGLRESLEKLDKNQNGLIEPEEVTPLARPYLERIMSGKSNRIRDPFRRPMPIDKIQESARIYFALKNGVDGDDVRPQGDKRIKPFGLDEFEPMVPAFGLDEVKFPYAKADWDFAGRTMRSHDENNDGYIDREEAAVNKWTHRNPFDDDLNKDDRLSRMELAQRYARRRLLEGDARELGRQAWRTGGDIEPSEKPPKDESAWWKENGSSHWLTAAMMGRFDSNRNGRLEAREAARMNMPLAQIDENQDGEITRDELFLLVKEMQEAAGDVTEGLPGWFFELDEDRDGQLALAEFMTEWTIARREEFQSYDINGDGLLEASEILRSTAITGGSYRQEKAEVLPPQRTIISEIEVEDDFLVADINVQLSITHSNVGFLDAYLTGPQGQRIELFTEVGGSGDHFEQTTFDDEAGTPIVKGRPPFKGSYKPEGLVKKQPGLNVFEGKTVKGVWQLVVRGSRSERFGMLHSWGLTVAPQQIDKAERPVVDGSQTSSEDAKLEDSAKPRDTKAGKKTDADSKKKNSGNPLIDLIDKSPFGP